MTTNSFNKLMRSIQDKKSIKNLKVPSASERNSDGTLKEPEKKEIKEDFDFDAHQAMANRSNPVKRGKFKLVKNGQHISHHETESAAMTAWSSMKDNRGVKIVKEEQELSEALYKVSHKGHPSIKKSDGNLLFPITDGKTEYINHMTRYPKSAEDTAKLLKNKGFKDVQVHKNGKLMEENDLEEGLKPEHNLRPGWMLKQDPELAKKFKDKKDALKALRYGKQPVEKETDLAESLTYKQQLSHLAVYPSRATFAKDLGTVKLFGDSKSEDMSNDEHYQRALTSATAHAKSIKGDVVHIDTRGHTIRAGSVAKVRREMKNKMMGESFIPSSIKVKIIKNGNKHELTIRQPNRKITGYHQSFDSREAAEKFVHQKWGADALQESVELDEGRMSELHATIGDHMDKHIATYKKMGGAESLMNHAEKAVPKIAKAHGIEHKHAEKFVSDYIDSKLNEETLDEAYTVKKYSGSPKSVAAGLSLKRKSDGSRVRPDGTLEFHQKDGNNIHIHHVWSEDGDKTSKYTVKTMSKRMYKRNYGNTMLEEVELEESVDPSVHLKKARSAASRDEQELYVKHMINYHKAMIKTNPDQAATHTDKLNRLKKDIGESVEYDLDEGFLDAVKRKLGSKQKPDAMDDVYAKAKAHVAKKHPGYKLASLGRGDNGEINYEVMHPKTGVTKEGVIKEETLDEVSGALLGRYIQAARKDKSAKIEHGKELDTDPKVKELRAKISDYYSRKEYKKSGESKHRDAINKAHDNIEKRKKKIDTDYPKSVNYWKRGKGIETAINKLKSGNLSEDTLNEVKSEPAYDHKYGLRHTIFDKKGYLTTKETWHKTSAAREKYADKVSQADNFNEIISHSDPRN